MLKLLIADSTETFVCALEATFRSEFEIRTCRDGHSALEQLSAFRPDAMILNLMLPFKDGLTVLQEAVYLPPAILGITTYMSEYIAQRAVDLGVGFLLISPCLSAVRLRLTDLIRQAQSENKATQAAAYLQMLNVPTHRDGYQQLCVGIPLFARDPGQRLSKELYPEIAALCGSRDSRAVEHSIRSVIEAAWNRREHGNWERYFPGLDSCPSNKVFIARMAELLKTENK